MSIYLSQLVLNPRNRNVRRDLTDCHGMHRTLMRAFPQVAETDAQHGAREQLGLLYRVETDTRSGAIRVLAQSLTQPNWARIDDPTYVLPLPDGGPNPDCKPIDDALDALKPDSRLLFRLRANPTKKIDTKTGTDGTRRPGRRVELTGDEAWNGWLARKAGANGFNVISVRASADEPALRQRTVAIFGIEMPDGDQPVPDMRANPGFKVTGNQGARGAGGRRLTFGSVLFEGRLVVTDVDAFRLALERGLGTGKAYGFGLLSIAPDRAVF